MNEKTVFVGLWLTVTLACWAAATPLFASNTRVVVAVDSIGMTVSDMDRSVAFYSNVLTFKPISDVEVDGPEYDQLWDIFGVRARVVRMQLGEQQLEGQESVAHWGMLNPAYMVCEAGSHQSPINISMPRHAQQQQEWLVFRYQSTGVRALDNGHTIQVNAPPRNELHLNGRIYDLVQFHFHDPSEHHIDGRTYPMEIHLVHQDRKGHVVVIWVAG